ncbi:hypothetical protein [Paracoccus cavernae]|uniref:hypothetical protein n=1 Tax=Paracoccus cavernae TaxID=1571207 RepID=UPI00363E53C1
MRFWSASGSRGRLHFVYLDAAGNRIINTNHVFRPAGNLFPAGEIITHTVTLGANAGGLVDLQVTNANWQTAAQIRFALDTAVVQSEPFKLYEFRIEDVTEADAAARHAKLSADAATASATSATQAAASETAAGQSAGAAANAKIEAETARGQAQVASGQAAQSSTDAAGSASQAQSHAALAAIAKDDAGNSASAAAASSVTATTKATEAGQSASLASSHAGTAQTQAGIATSKAAEALTSASGAAGSAIEAKSFSQLAALALSGGSAKNPTFLDWSGVFPPHIGVVAGSSGTIGKAVGKYGYAFELVTTSVATVGPYVFHDKTTLNGVTNPQKLLITIEAEPLSGSLAGMVLQCGWHDAPTNSWGWAAVRIGPNLTVGGGIQTYQAVLERPAAWAAGKTIDDVSIRFMPSYTTAGATAAINRVKLHRFDAQVILADSYIDQQLKTKATLDGIAETSYVMRVKAGGASAGLEMVAASNPNGPASAIRMSADEILLDGTIKGPMMEIGAIGAREIAARSIVASALAIMDLTNLVPDDQLQDDVSWIKGIAFRLRPITARGDVKSVGDLYYTHADNVNANVQYAYSRNFFPVTPGMSSLSPVRSSGLPER